jgi:hypothetical protein
MKQVTENSVLEKKSRQISENFHMGFRIYSVLVSNLLGAKVPFFCGPQIDL